MHNKKNIMEAKNKLEQSKSQEKEKSEKAPVQPFPDKKNPKIGNQDELLLLIKSTF